MAVLECDNVKHEHAGTYTCVAENSMGSTETDSLVSIEGKREPPKLPVCVLLARAEVAKRQLCEMEMEWWRCCCCYNWWFLMWNAA